ncbi:MAG: phospholipase D-like domain-containing protein [Pseudomonadota bacterium]|nr:phospholipase D-like domain-containing protein [Pseudomonadota bacterium]
MIYRSVEALYGVEDAVFRRSIGALLGPPLLPGNRVTTLVNGDGFYPAMLEAIRAAERTITLETYMMWSGRIADTFVDALAERARAGVCVHITLDWFGSRRLGEDARARLRAAGVELSLYRPPSWGNLRRFDQRTHRRILVVDGRIGFAGGMGITDVWTGDAQGPGHWRDTAVRVEGPVVAQLQGAFLDNWVESTGTLLHGDAYFPDLPPCGDVVAQAFWSSPHEGNYNARVMYHLSIASARRTIRIANAYFVPDKLMMRTLLDARVRGVEVELLVAGPTDIPLTRWAGRLRWGALLGGGVRIFVYQPAVLHAKTMVIDDIWATVGSANVDSLSLRLLDEVNVNILDANVAAEHVAIFERDKAQSHEVTLAAWHRRSWFSRTKEWFAGLLESRM